MRGKSMNKIELTGQIITGTNYATSRPFHFTSDSVSRAAKMFLASGISKIEVPADVLDPDSRFADGYDEATLKKTVSSLPAESSVISTYLGNEALGRDNDVYLSSQKQKLTYLTEAFPDMKYAMLHPGDVEFGDPDSIVGIVDTWARLADYAATLREGFQLCFHNHYDSNGETADQMRTYLGAIAAADNPCLRWGIDTAHSHGMGDAMLDIMKDYAYLVGDYFHIKARIPSFDRYHGGDDYRKDRDSWDGGLYAGAVNVADPEIATPLEEMFSIIREKARPSRGIVYGALEIDNPRQHPLLEIMCGTLFLRNVHGIESAAGLSNDEIVRRIFPARA